MIQKQLAGLVKSGINCSTSKTCVDLILNGEADNSKQVKKPDFATTAKEINLYILAHLPSRRTIQFDNNTTRDSLIKLITAFLSPKLNVKCQCPNCEFNGYSELPDDYFTRPNLMCYECGSPSHRECYENIINPSVGILYLCGACFPSATNESSVVPATDDSNMNGDGEKKNEKKNEVGEEKISEEKKEDEPQPHPANLMKRRTFDRTLNMCSFFRSNKCKFGNDGKQCRFYHPPVCRKYKEWGNDEKSGCNKGEECNYFHVKICKSGGSARKCKRSNCNLVHVRVRKQNSPPPPISTDKNIPPSQINEMTYRGPRAQQNFLILLDQLAAAAKEVFHLAPKKGKRGRSQKQQAAHQRNNCPNSCC